MPLTHLNNVDDIQETFISADDLRVNLWHLGTNDQSFNIVDIKPANMEDLTEVGAGLLTSCVWMRKRT